MPPTACKTHSIDYETASLLGWFVLVACWVVPFLAYTRFSKNCSFVIDSSVSVCKDASANYCVQVKASLEDRVITSILRKSSDVAFSTAVSAPSFCSIYFVDTLHDSNISLVLCHLSAYCQVKRFDDSLHKTSERL